MNKAESSRLAGYLEALGYNSTPVLQNAELVVLNTCVVRKSSEDKVTGTLGYLKGKKKANPQLSILVTGCFVDSEIEKLKKQYDYVDLFFRPGDFDKLVSWAQGLNDIVPTTREKLPIINSKTPCIFVPIIQGCNNFCSYCIVPYRRGRERSRPPEEIISEVTCLVNNGVKEVTLLGQNVNSYGQDLPTPCDLSDLLIALNDIDSLARIRYLTNHPKNMGHRLIETTAALNKVCEHINLPVQSGDDTILKAMRRDYTAEHYVKLVDAIRSGIPGVSISTDIIVGFPGETHEQFERTLALCKEIRFDTIHIAAYSTRPGTIASKEYEDNIPSNTKRERVNTIEKVQAQIAAEINSQFMDKTVEVLVESKKNEKWYGRTVNDQLVFFIEAGDCQGLLKNVKIKKTSPWALQGEPA